MAIDLGRDLGKFLDVLASGAAFDRVEPVAAREGYGYRATVDARTTRAGEEAGLARDHAAAQASARRAAYLPVFRRR